MTVTIRGISVENRDAQIGSDFVREYVVTYLVTTDDWHDGPQTVLDAPGIPALNDYYSIGNDRDDTAIVHSKRVSPHDAPDEWTVEVTYRTRSYGGTTPGTNPLDMSPKITAYTVNRNVVIPGIYQDPRNARPEGNFDFGVHMSNGEHCDPPPEIEISEPVVNIQRNVQHVNWPWITSITNAVNSDIFFGCAPRQLRLCTPKIESAYDATIGLYWKLSYDLAYRFETWDVQILNRGTWYKQVPDPDFQSGDPGRKPFKDDEGHPCYGLLDEWGLPINFGHPEYEGIYYEGGDLPTFQRLRVYRELDFNALGLLV